MNLIDSIKSIPAYGDCSINGGGVDLIYKDNILIWQKRTAVTIDYFNRYYYIPGFMYDETSIPKHIFWRIISTEAEYNKVRSTLLNNPDFIANDNGSSCVYFRKSVDLSTACCKSYLNGTLTRETRDIAGHAGIAVGAIVYPGNVYSNELWTPSVPLKKGDVALIQLCIQTCSPNRIIAEPSTFKTIDIPESYIMIKGVKGSSKVVNITSNKTNVYTKNLNHGGEDCAYADCYLGYSYEATEDCTIYVYGKSAIEMTSALARCSSGFYAAISAQGYR